MSNLFFSVNFLGISVYGKHLWHEPVCHGIRRPNKQLTLRTKLCIANYVTLSNCIDVALTIHLDQVLDGHLQIHSTCTIVLRTVKRVSGVKLSKTTSLRFTACNTLVTLFRLSLLSLGNMELQHFFLNDSSVGSNSQIVSQKKNQSLKKYIWVSNFRFQKFVRLQ